MAPFDFIAEFGAPVGAGVTVASKVQLRVLATAKSGQKRYVHELVVSSVACIGQRPLVAVLAPIDCYSRAVGEPQEGNDEKRE